VASQLREYRPFRDAREFARGLKLKSGSQWRTYCMSGRKPVDIPASPNKTYKQHWKGIGDWLGTGNVAPRLREYRSFKHAHRFVRRVGLRSSAEWREYCASGRKPVDIPSNPNTVYKRQFKGFGYWLGTGTVAPGLRHYRSFRSARTFVGKLGLRTWADWRAYCKSGRLPPDIPVSANRYYRREWKGMADWLGSDSVKHVRKGQKRPTA
jgi:hypothetical protein